MALAFFVSLCDTPVSAFNYDDGGDDDDETDELLVRRRLRGRSNQVTTAFLPAKFFIFLCVIKSDNTCGTFSMREKRGILLHHCFFHLLQRPSCES